MTTNQFTLFSQINDKGGIGKSNAVWALIVWMRKQPSSQQRSTQTKAR